MKISQGSKFNKFIVLSEALARKKAELANREKMQIFFS
jgi:hypothetical protein